MATLNMAKSRTKVWQKIIYFYVFNLSNLLFPFFKSCFVFRIAEAHLDHRVPTAFIPVTITSVSVPSRPHNVFPHPVISHYWMSTLLSIIYNLILISKTIISINSIIWNSSKKQDKIVPFLRWWKLAHGSVTFWSGAAWVEWRLLCERPTHDITGDCWRPARRVMSFRASRVRRLACTHATFNWRRHQFNTRHDPTRLNCRRHRSQQQHSCARDKLLESRTFENQKCIRKLCLSKGRIVENDKSNSFGHFHILTILITEHFWCLGLLFSKK